MAGPSSARGRGLDAGRAGRPAALPTLSALAATAATALACAAGVLSATAARADGDPQRGQQAYEARCGACHSVSADRVGPRHAGVFGRRAGAVEGFDYSPALKASTVVWNAESLERWLTDPEALIPGQRMGYRLQDARVRAEIVAYLATLRVAK